MSLLINQRGDNTMLLLINQRGDNTMTKRKGTTTNNNDRSTKHYTKNYRLSNTYPTKNMVDLRKGKQFLLQFWHPLCYSCQSKKNMCLHWHSSWYSDRTDYTEYLCRMVEFLHMKCNLQQLIKHLFHKLPPFLWIYILFLIKIQW